MKCIEDNCKTTASYNIKGETKALYCTKHKLDNMIDIRHKLCNYSNCNTIACYNKKGEKQGIYCSKHKEDYMINVLAILCNYNECYKYPCYNKEGEKRGLYCATHKEDGMINVIDRTCIYSNCRTLAYYNKKGEKRGLYCATHKEIGMIDIKNVICIYPNCTILANYNKKGEKRGLYCATHKEDNMIDIKHPICIHLDCKKLASCNYKGETKVLYCATHKKDGMIDIMNKRCKTDLCDIIVTSKNYEGYCLNCYIHLFPDRPNTYNYKTKEKAVVDYIFEQFPLEEYTWITDKKIQDGCSRRRPDLFLDLGYQIIIVEVDENQHEDYDCSCENKRLMLLSQDVGHRPIIFIRFNPDEYINDNNEKVTSCWGINGKGICTIKKTKQKEWNQRLESLKNQIEYWTDLENRTEKMIEVIQLFYDKN